jgi:predicted adenylyl cyclase CyaB
MPREIEVKVLEVDKRSVEHRLRELGARRVFDGTVTTLYYDFPDRRLHRRDAVLRVRELGGNTILSCKTDIRHGRVKSARELEVIVQDGSMVERILEAIGLAPYVRIRKHRTAYSLGRYHVDIDTLPGIPAYLEIEAPNQGMLFSLLGRLGFERREARPWGTKQLLRHYGKEDYGVLRR